MKLDLASVLKLLISIGLGGCIIWYLDSSLSSADKEAIFTSFQNIHWPIVICTLALGALACVFRALRWKILLKPLGYQPRFNSVLGSIFIMYLANLIFPRLGEVVRCSILYQREEIPMEKSLGTMITERLVDIIFFGFIVLITFALEMNRLIEILEQYQAQNALQSGNSWMKLVILGLIIIASIALYRSRFRAILIAKLRGLWDGVATIFKMENPVLFIAYSLGINMIYFANTVLMYHAIDGLESLQISSGFLVLTAGTLGIGLTQGGIGAFQLFVTETLTLYQIARPIGLAYSWISWSVQTIILVVLGIGYFIYFALSKKQHGQKA